MPHSKRLIEFADSAVAFNFTQFCFARLYLRRFRVFSQTIFYFVWLLGLLIHLLGIILIYFAGRVLPSVAGH